MNVSLEEKKKWRDNAEGRCYTFFFINVTGSKDINTVNRTKLKPLKHKNLVFIQQFSNYAKNFHSTRARDEKGKCLKIDVQYSCATSDIMHGFTS